MKKLITGAVVVLIAALIGLKYFASRQKAPSQLPVVAGQQAEPQGVALPEGAKEAASAPAESTYIPTQATGTYDILSLPPAAMSVKGACDGGSPKDIMENHGKTWGFFTGRRIAFDGKKTREIYGYVGDYYACMAASRQDITICNELPGEIDRDGTKIDITSSPLGICREKTGLFLLKAYIAGKAKEQAACMGYFGEWDSQNLSRISPPDFCAAAAQGPEKILAYTKDKLPNIFPNMQKMLAFTKDVCGGDPLCLANNGLWEGIKTGNASRCPAPYAPHCAALAQKSQAPCAEILMEMSKKYCGYYKDLLKAGGGYAGITADEVKEDLRAKAQKKADEEKAKKQEEAVMKETNEKVRKLIGKKGGE